MSWVRLQIITFIYAYLQVYLIDLKRGIEVKEFAQLPNVRIAKDEVQALQVLQALRNEMHERFFFMEKNGLKKIDPNLHELDLIVVGIDEASVLYGKTSGSKSKTELVAKARELTDEIAKLARAAGIHLVIATQKPLKESLDTKTLENLTGRMVFKMSTHAGSNMALGNVKAYALPDIKGRGIWAGGNRYIEDHGLRLMADLKKTHNPKGMLNIWQVVKSILIKARKEKLIPCDPFENIQRPRQDLRQDSFWIRDEITQFLRGNTNAQLYPFYFVA